MSNTTNKLSPELRERAIRQVLDHEHEHPSRWAAITSIAAKIGCTAQILRAFSDPSDTGWSKKMREVTRNENGRSRSIRSDAPERKPI